MNRLDVLKREAIRMFKLRAVRKFYEGHYYAKNRPRNAMYTCLYRHQKAVLKVYDDPRETHEGSALEHFLKHNTSALLTAPKLFSFREHSPHHGWLLMEHLPEGGSFFPQPLPENDRAFFLDLFFEYRKHFPKKPPQKVSFVESLRADIFHLYRISRWLELAQLKDSSLLNFLNSREFPSLFTKALNALREEFIDCPMIYCHGHFKPHELYRSREGKYYLTDFAHAQMRPVGYELAFIVWADHIMSQDWKLPYAKWSSGIFEWEELIGRSALLTASLIERILGSILADVIASERPMLEKKTRLTLLMKLLKHYIRQWMKISELKRHDFITTLDALEKRPSIIPSKYIWPKIKERKMRKNIFNG